MLVHVLCGYVFDSKAKRKGLICYTEIISIKHKGLFM